MSDDLVERVARAIAEAYVADVSHGQLTLADSEYHWSDWRLEARAAIAVVLEEAAKVCDEIETAEHRKWKQHADMMAQGASDGAGDCAAAIRAMIPK